MKNKVILGAISIFLFSCATNNLDESTEGPGDRGRGADDAYSSCKWYIDATCEEQILCGFGEAKKESPSLSRKAAIDRARAGLAEQIAARVELLLTDHMKENGVAGNPMTSEYTESIVKYLSNQVLDHSSADDTCVLSDDTWIVRVTWNKAIAKEITAAAVKREKAFYSKFLSEEAFKRLEEETITSDRWDEELIED